MELNDFGPEAIQYLEKEVLRLGHYDEYISQVKALCDGIKENETIAVKKNDIYYSNGTYEASLLSLFATVRGLQAILDDSSPL